MARASTGDNHRERGRLERVLRHVESRDLERYLAGRRWYAEKGAPVHHAAIVELVPVDQHCAIAIVEVTLDDGARRLYQLPLRLDDSDVADLPALTARMAGAEARLIDATSDEGFRRWLATAIAQSAETLAGDAGFRGVALDAEGARVAAQLPSRAGNAEQSNTSLVFGDRAILKLFRRLEPGVNPDVEVSSYLTSVAGFAHSPALLGYTELRDAHGVRVTAMMQELVDGASDAWAWLLQQHDEGVDTLSGEIRSLGEVTRALHDALASAPRSALDFVAETATESDVERWVNGARKSSAQAREAAGREETAEAPWLSPHAVDARLTALWRIIGDDAGERIRHHGDYHLGQVLRSAAGHFFIIDLEGEPSKSLAERRERSSALRDVAGMLRSFSYASATVGREAGRSDEWMMEWEQMLRSSFLDGYFAAGGARFLPRDRAKSDALIAVFEMEKAFYELRYELRNRPDWVWIPQRGLDRLFASS